MGTNAHSDAVWSAAEVDRLPDSAFLLVSPGGEKDAEGKTTPRSLRHFPYRSEGGAIDLPHLRDAIGRIPQSDIPADKKKELQERAEKLLSDAEKKPKTDGVARGVTRYDAGELRPPTRLDNGWLRCDGFIGKAGILEYRTPDGQPWREYRPPDEAFREDALESFALVPLTNGHPPPNPRLGGMGLLDASNTNKFQVGSVSVPRKDGSLIRAEILITDPAAIRDADAGRTQLSCGYLCDVDPTPGVFDGQRYDAIQRNVRGNHVALVSVGRAGPEARVRVDSLQSEPVASIHQGENTMKLRIDGIDFEVPENPALAQAFEKATRERQDALRASGSESEKLRSELEKEKARADAAQAALKAKTDELAAAPKKIRDELEARSKLVALGVEILGAEAKVDEMADAEIKKAIILHTSPEAKLDGQSETYLQARFDAAVELALQSALERGSGARSSRVDELPGDIHDDGLSDAERRFRAAASDAHKRRASAT